MECRAYLDIETTGLSPDNADLTVIGIHIENGDSHDVIQMVGEEISSTGLLQILEKTDILYTYNGARFDLPFIKEKLSVDLKTLCMHKDLMYSCRKRNLYGGLKLVEKQLGIKRKLPDVDGKAAVDLWHNFSSYGDRASLDKLLRYNKEDVVNLRVLREKLGIS